jgi:hypothetical protein
MFRKLAGAIYMLQIIFLSIEAPPKLRQFYFPEPHQNPAALQHVFHALAGAVNENVAISWLIFLCF